MKQCGLEDVERDGGGQLETQHNTIPLVPLGCRSDSVSWPGLSCLAFYHSNMVRET